MAINREQQDNPAGATSSARSKQRIREAALVALLDDPSPTVQAAIEQEFQRLGNSRLTFLRAIANDRSHPLTRQAKHFVDKVIGPEPAQRLVEYIRAQSFDLETGMYLINKVIVPDVKLSVIRQALQFLSDRCRELMVKPMTTREQCKLMNRVLFHECGFRGNSTDYDNPLNSCIDAVLVRRMGLPITLSVIYLLVAERLGIELEPIGVPGHFMVAGFDEEPPFYIDAFERGRFRTGEEVRQLLLMQNLPADYHYLAPVPVGEVLCRVCRNLAYHFDQRKEPRWANRFRLFVREFERNHDRQVGNG